MVSLSSIVRRTVKQFMKISIITLFPELINSYLSSSIIGRAAAKGIFSYRVFNLRDFGKGKRLQVDDKLFAGTRGMLLQAEPILQAFLAAISWHLESEIPPDSDESIRDIINIWLEKKAQAFYLSPKGPVFTQNTAVSWSNSYEYLLFLCGHYEGIDSRVLEFLPFQEISLGNFVLTGGELAVLSMVDATLRMVNGVLPESAAYTEESLYTGSLECCQFTQPAIWRNYAVPQVLLQGNHALQNRYRKFSSYHETLVKRPDLFDKLELSLEDLTDFIADELAKK